MEERDGLPVVFRIIEDAARGDFAPLGRGGWLQLDEVGEPLGLLNDEADRGALQVRRVAVAREELAHLKPHLGPPPRLPSAMANLPRKYSYTWPSTSRSPFTVTRLENSRTISQS